MEQQVKIKFDDLIYTGVPIIKVKSEFGELNLLVDTGASLNALDLQFLNENLEFNCECKGFGGAISLSEIKKVELYFNDKSVIVDVQFADLYNIKSYFEGLEIHGVLGSRFFIDNGAKIDYENMVLIV